MVLQSLTLTKQMEEVVRDLAIAFSNQKGIACSHIANRKNHPSLTKGESQRLLAKLLYVGEYIESKFVV